MQKGHYQILFRSHALIRAFQRRIPQELIEDTIQTGSYKRFGKHMVKIEKQYRKGKVCCVGQIHVDCIKIITITDSKEEGP